MKLTAIFLVLFTMISFSCSEDENEDVSTFDLTTKKAAYGVIIDIIYVLPSKISFDENIPSSINSSDYIKHLNDHYFHHYDIDLILGVTKNIQNDELFDLKDNRGTEVTTFMNETKDVFHKNRISIYMINRSNIIAIAGMGKDQRVLLTDDNVYTSTSPHEIGHALGLFHSHEQGNIMNDNKADSRHHFNEDQVIHMKKRIDQINAL